METTIDRPQETGIEMKSECYIVQEELSDDNADTETVPDQQVDEEEEGDEKLMEPLVSGDENMGGIPQMEKNEIRSRKRVLDDGTQNENRHIRANPFNVIRKRNLQQCCSHTMEVQKNLLRNTIALMNFLAKILFWVSLVALSVGVFWYSRELALHG